MGMEVIYVARVFAHRGEGIEVLIARFKRVVEKEGLLAEWKKHEFFLKPSLIRHEKDCRQKYNCKHPRIRRNDRSPL